MRDRVTANLPARSFEETAEFYAALGFRPSFRDDDWMILQSGDLEIEFFPHPDLDPGTSWFSACVRIADGGRLYAEWSKVELPSTGIPRITVPQDIGHGLQMFAIIDPNGSLLRCLFDRE